MIITVNDLIQDVLQETNVVGDGAKANGNQVKRALWDFNKALSELNNNEYLLYNVHQYDVSGKVIKIGPSEDYDIFVAEAPMTLRSVSRKIGERYVPLTIVTKEALDTSTYYGAHPTAYAIDTEYDSERDCMVTIVRLNGNNIQGIRITFLGEIPEYKINDSINLPRTYIDLIEDALAVRTCRRYKLECLPMYKDSLDKKCEDIERINNSNRPITLEGAIAGSFTDDYYDGISGFNWSV